MTVIRFPDIKSKQIEQTVQIIPPYKSPDEHIDGIAMNEFRNGLRGFINYFDYLLSERGYIPGDLKSEIALSTIKQEDDYIRNEDNETAESNLEFESVELGNRGITIMEYSANINLLTGVYSRIIKEQALCLDGLTEIIARLSLDIAFSEIDITDDSILKDYCTISGYATREDALMAAEQMLASTRLIGLFHECQALHTGDKKELDMLVWDNYTNESDIFSDDINVGLEYAGSRMLRLPHLIESQRRNEDMRSFFDNVRMYASRDAFRQYIAKKNGIFRENSSTVLIDREYEMTCFDWQYRTLSKSEQEIIDKDEIVQLRRLMMRLPKYAHLPIVITEAPFMIESDCMFGTHKLEYEI